MCVFAFFFHFNNCELNPNLKDITNNNCNYNHTGDINKSQHIVVMFVEDSLPKQLIRLDVVLI